MPPRWTYGSIRAATNPADRCYDSAEISENDRFVNAAERAGDVPARVSRTSAAYGLDRFTSCKAAFLAAHLLSATETYVLWGYGDTGRAPRRAPLAHSKRPAYVVEVRAARFARR